MTSISSDEFHCAISSNSIEYFMDKGVSQPRRQLRYLSGKFMFLNYLFSFPWVKPVTTVDIPIDEGPLR